MQQQGKEKNIMSMEIYTNYGGYATGTAMTAKKEHTAQDYYEKLCRKFSQISINTDGQIRTGSRNKIVLNLSKDCLNRMANDEAYAKKIEEDIASIPDAHKQMFAKAKRDGMEIQGFAVRINADGSMQCSCSGSTRTSDAGRGNGALRAGKKRTDAVGKRRREQEELLQNAAQKRAERKDLMEETTQEALLSSFDWKA